MKDPVKIKANLEEKAAKQQAEAAGLPFQARFVEGLFYSSASHKTVNIKKASEVFGEIKTASYILVPRPSLFLRLGLLEVVCSNGKSEGAKEALEELRFSFSEGKFVNPSRLLFGENLTMDMVATRLGMGDHPGFRPEQEAAVRLVAEMDVLIRIGKEILGD